MSNRYSFVWRKSGKPANIKGVSTRDRARQIKRMKRFSVAIWDNVNSSFVR